MKRCGYVNCDNITINPKYCSLSCGAKQQFIDKPPIKKINMVECARFDCYKTFNAVGRKSNQKYCSRSCATKINNIGVKRNKIDLIVIKSCLFCKTKLNRSSYKFCSIACSHRYNKANKIQQWLAGDTSIVTTTDGLARFAKNFLIEGAGFKCTLPTCAVPGGFSEINPITGRCPLEIDHVDGNCYNNKIENLRVVCPNCHALTSNYRALNKNGQRKYRRKLHASIA